MKLYQYTRYLPDGKEEALTPRKKMSLEELQREVGGFIEVLPSTYYAHQKWGKCMVYVNEEGRFDVQNKRNPFFLEIMPNYYVVGMALKEEVSV
jgi:hypothetical protein